jgi:purine-nucleoside phosphorylase
MLNELKEALAFLHTRIERPPSIAIVLGSGLGGLAAHLQGERLQIPGTDIPGYPRSTVAGHSGSLIFGQLSGVDVVLQAGRVHLYEGYSPDEVVFPVRLLALLGVRTFVITNASGAVRRDFEPGDLVLLRDHINLMGRSPLAGPHHEDLGPRFVDMTHAYSPGLRVLAHEAACARGIELREGVYAAMLGPAYETPAEIGMCAAMGVDLVGMSTVPEVLALAPMGREVLVISCVTNKAAGIAVQPLSHEEVVETGRRVQGVLTALVGDLLVRIESRP